MSKTLMKLSAAALALSFALPVQAEELTADSVVATVNGKEITLGHMLAVRSNLPEQYQQLGDDVLWDGIMDQLIQQTLLVQAGPDEVSQRVALSLDNEERALRAAEQAQSAMDEAVTEAALTGPASPFPVAEAGIDMDLLGLTAPNGRSS
mgnify:CR=1 FL=1